jgi:hypothetical protein
VIVNIQRGGPGLGNIAPAQGDYWQATRGGAHGDYHMPVLAPASVQEMADLTYRAFDMADEYRTPVMILGDGYLGQMMEPVALPGMRDLTTLPAKPWATTGAKGRGQNLISSIHLEPEHMEAHVRKLFAGYDVLKAKETRHDEYKCGDAEHVLVAYGILARVGRSVVDLARAEGSASCARSPCGHAVGAPRRARRRAAREVVHGPRTLHGRDGRGRQLRFRARSRSASTASRRRSRPGEVSGMFGTMSARSERGGLIAMTNTR